jgi:hypothetical protein
MKSYEGRTAPFLTNLGIRWRRIVSLKPLTVNPRERATWFAPNGKIGELQSRPERFGGEKYILHRGGNAAPAN